MIETLIVIGLIFLIVSSLIGLLWIMIVMWVVINNLRE